jgi:glycosyltransferase involved in cell wall biosynthesis
MRIGIDAFPALQTHGGIGGYVRGLLQALAALESGHELIGYVPKHSKSNAADTRWVRPGEIRWVETGRCSLRYRGWLDGLDLYHGTNFKFDTQGRHGAVLTIHDLWLDRYPQYSRKFLGQRFSSYRTRLRANRAAHIIADSRHTAQDVQELYGLPPGKVSVIYPGASSEFFPARGMKELSSLRGRYGIPEEPYILFVGGADPRKNHRGLCEAFAHHQDLRKKCCLVVVGDPVHRMGSVVQTTSRLNIQERVVCLGTVPVADLRLLYAHADLFVFPSLYEGFGFPVLEAMACGTPVITSNRSSLPEVAGDAAVLVNPEDPPALAEAMRRVLFDQSLRESLKAKGVEQVKRFTWQKAARQTLEVYRQACGVG